MNIKINISFYKVIVFAVDIFETIIVDEKNFSSLENAIAFKNTIDKNLLSILVEV